MRLKIRNFAAHLLFHSKYKNMVYPIVGYGSPVLRKKADPFTEGDNTDLKELSENMFETMYNANGVGLAGPQIGLSKRIFVVDAEPLDEEELKGFKKVFINAEKIEETGEEWDFEEGCLSIPNIRGDVSRPERIKLRYFDENMKEHEEVFEGLAARVIQHEYDHIEGILFTDMISPLKKRLLQNKLNKIIKGRVKVDYTMRFAKK